MAFQDIDLLAVVRNIDGTIAGNTTLFTTEGGGTQRFFPYFWVCDVTAAVGGTSSCGLTIGTNSPNFDNMQSGIGLDGTKTGYSILISISGGTDRAQVAPVATAVVLKVTNPPIGATTYTFDVHVYGAYN